MCPKTPNSDRPLVISDDAIVHSIFFIRGQKVILDADLAVLYGVTTKRLNEQIKRNARRFPPDFMFQLTPNEKSEVVANCDHLSRLRFSHVFPNAFTEHGAIMAATVLNSDRAIEMSLFVVRAFVRLRSLLAAHQDLAEKVAQLERRMGGNDRQIAAIIDAIKRLMAPPPASPRRPIGFLPPTGEAK